MPKKGVFGMKEMPLDSVRGTSKPKPRAKEVRIRAVENGFIVSCSPDTHDEYMDREHAADSVEKALEIAGKHLEGKKEDKE